MRTSLSGGRRPAVSGMTLPFGTRVRVTRLSNGRSVVLRINDRGPFVRGRIIDISHAAARKLDMLREGVVPVTVEVLSAGEEGPRTAGRGF